MDLVSFDIFDTALIRKCGRPEVIFDLLAHRLYPGDMAAREDFVHWRSYQAKGESITEMYAGVGADFPEYTVQQLVEAELAVEAENLTVNPAVKPIIDRCRAEGKSIIFLSDMYLPSEFLRSVLVREGLFCDGDEVIVSCEWNARKSNGVLYDKVREKYSPASWHHYGDHPHSDVKMAKRKGVSAHHTVTGFTAFEQRLIDSTKGMMDGWQLSLLAGLSRYARLSLGNSAAAVLAADYVVAAYLPFVEFVLRNARESGIEMLQFLSRDGYILYEMAKVLPHDGIDLNYLFVSRKSLSSGSPLLPDYLRQEGLMDHKCALVDVGWVGTSRAMINQLLRDNGVRSVLTYYLGVRRDVLPRRDGEYLSYYRFGGISTGDATALIESYFSASPWPSTANYRIDESTNRIVPIFKGDAEYKDSDVTVANREAGRIIAGYLAGCPVLSPAILRKWSEAAINSLSRLEDRVDLSPIVNMEGTADDRLVRKLSVRDLLEMTLRGKKHFDMFEKGSYEVTVGRAVTKLLYPIHDITTRILFRIAPKLRRFG